MKHTSAEATPWPGCPPTLPQWVHSDVEARFLFLSGSPPASRANQTMTQRPELVLWSRLIQAAAAVVLALSALLLIAPHVGAAAFNLVYFGSMTSPVAAPAVVQGYIHFANGIIGAVLAGWMLTIIVMARGPFLAGERSAWITIAWPLAGWYLIDTAFSLAHGVWGNVLLNTGTALMFGVPLLGSRRHFV
jgi:hypothetical protein